MSGFFTEWGQSGVPEGYCAVQDFFDYAIQVFVLLGMKVVDVADEPAELSWCIYVWFWT